VFYHVVFLSDFDPKKIYYFLQKVQKDRPIEDISPTESVVENSPLAAEEASSTDEGLVNHTVFFLTFKLNALNWILVPINI